MKSGTREKSPQPAWSKFFPRKGEAKHSELLFFTKANLEVMGAKETIARVIKETGGSVRIYAINGNKMLSGAPPVKREESIITVYPPDSAVCSTNNKKNVRRPTKKSRLGLKIVSTESLQLKIVPIDTLLKDSALPYPEAAANRSWHIPV